ncbi:hypothetical protein [Streptomyces sp. NPDC012508]|uniref:hypothetical protein n=1 Tax=Streptomyces sp. NPDC012508 TaxID=3364837 RepID=UPI0036B45AA4
MRADEGGTPPGQDIGDRQRGHVLADFAVEAAGEHSGTQRVFTHRIGQHPCQEVMPFQESDRMALPRHHQEGGRLVAGQELGSSEHGLVGGHGSATASEVTCVHERSLPWW